MRRRRVPDDCVSDSNMPVIRSTDAHFDEKSHSGHFSDTALCVRQKKRRRKRMGDTIQPVPEEPALPHLPPSPSVSRMVREKTEGLNLSDTLLQEIKEMSRHLRIVNWLWDSQRMPLRGRGHRQPSNPGTKSSSGNLVIVRRNSHNWFDTPRLQAPREELTPVSVDPELQSDYEEELLQLM